jgi:hypothetical protein
MFLLSRVELLALIRDIRCNQETISAYAALNLGALNNPTEHRSLRTHLARESDLAFTK